MLTIELINNNIPRLQLKDSVSKALRLISDFKVTHLPVVDDDKFLGLISEDDLLDQAQPKMPIELMQEHFIHAAVHDNEHFLNAVTCSNLVDSTVVPVINEENELLGVITTNELLKTIGNFAGTNELGGIIVLEMERSQACLPLHCISIKKKFQPLWQLLKGMTLMLFTILVTRNLKMKFTVTTAT
jgi:acetoin utilization protein AcuB